MNNIGMQLGHMRRQRPRGSTTREAVVSAALTVIDTVGVEHLTIRSVAKTAGAPPMSLYTHFSNKNELLDLVYMEVSRRIYPPEKPPTSWQADLLEVCCHMRNVLTEHPSWIQLLARPSAPLSVPLRERVLKQMVEAGVAPGAAMAGLATAIMTTIGLVLADVALRDTDGQAALAKRYDRLRAWAETSRGDENKVTRMAVSKLRRLNLDETYLLAMRSLIAGLDANLERTSS